MVAGDGAVVGQPIHDLELLQRDLVNLIHDINRGHVDARALDHIDEVVHRDIVPTHHDVRVVDAVLLRNEETPG